MKNPNPTKTPTKAELTLKPDFVDLRSSKVQMAFAVAAALAICLCSWSPALHIGFLLDDFLHIDYIYRALHGNSADFLANFSSNWAGSDLMKSYRPLVSVSLFLDYCIWGANAWGFHLTNLLMLWGCSVLVGLIALELSGLKGNRLGASASIWAVLLFAVYPLHLEAAAWIIGRVDLLCVLFYLASIFAFLRFKLIREPSYYNFSLFAFVIAVLSKEMAYTLPVVITAIEVLLHPLYEIRSGRATSKRSRSITGVLAFWFITGLLLSLRLFFLHDLIGGYGTGGPSAIARFLREFTHSVSTFPHSGTLSAILFPVNLDLLNRVGQSAWDMKETLAKILGGAYLVIAASALLRLFKASASLRIFSFLLLWIVVGILPTYQIWGVFPNLVGGRLFFLSSAPFAILLAFMALPSIDVIGARMAKIHTYVGALALFVVLCIWSIWLHFDLQAWRGATDCLRGFRQQIGSTLVQAGPHRSIMILNLPTDYSGAGMVTRGRYLSFMLRPPTSDFDFSARVKTLDPTDEIPAGLSAAEQAKFISNYDYGAKLKHAIEDKSIAHIFMWRDPMGNSEYGTLSSWVPDLQTGLADGSKDGSIATHERTIQFNQSCKFMEVNANDPAQFEHVDLNKLQDLTLNKGTEWSVEQAGGRRFALTKDGLRITPGAEDLLLVLPELKLSPLQIKTVELKAKVLNAATKPPMGLAWSASNAVNQTEQFSILPFENKDNTLLIHPGLSLKWAQTPSIGRLAILLPKGDYELELSRIEFF